METGLLGFFIILALWGYNLLMREIRHRKVPSSLSLRMESLERDNDLDLPRYLEDLVRTVFFPVTPVPGMEVQDWGIDGAVINRIVIGEDGIKVYCSLKCKAEEFSSELAR